MADEEDPITITIGEDCEDLDPYRANIATPQNLESMRFWVQQELKQIENAFSRLKDYLDCIAGEIEIPSETPEEECEFTICCTEFVEVGGPGSPPVTTICKEYDCDALSPAISSAITNAADSSKAGYWLMLQPKTGAGTWTSETDQTGNGNDFGVAGVLDGYRYDSDYDAAADLDIDPCTESWSARQVADNQDGLSSWVTTGAEPGSDLGRYATRSHFTVGLAYKPLGNWTSTVISLFGFSGSGSGQRLVRGIMNSASDLRLNWYNGSAYQSITLSGAGLPGIGEWQYIIVEGKLPQSGLTEDGYFRVWNADGYYEEVTAVGEVGGIAKGDGTAPRFAIGNDAYFRASPNIAWHNGFVVAGAISAADRQAIFDAYNQNMVDYVDPDPDCGTTTFDGEPESYQYEERVIYPKDGQILKYNAAKGCWEYADECCPEVPEFPGYAFNFCDTRLSSEPCLEYECNAYEAAMGSLADVALYTYQDGGPTPSPGDTIPDSVGSADLVLSGEVDKDDPEWPSPVGFCSGYMYYSYWDGIGLSSTHQWNGTGPSVTGDGVTLGGIFTRGAFSCVFEATFERTDSVPGAQSRFVIAIEGQRVNTTWPGFNGAYTPDILSESVHAVHMVYTATARTIEIYVDGLLAHTWTSASGVDEVALGALKEVIVRARQSTSARAYVGIGGRPWIEDDWDIVRDAYIRNFEDYVDHNPDCGDEDILIVAEPNDGDTIQYNAADGCWDFVPLESNVSDINDTKTAFDSTWSSSRIASELGGLVPFSQFNQLKLRVANLESIVGVTAAVADGGGAAAPQVFTALDGGSASDADTTFNLAEMLDGGASA